MSDCERQELFKWRHLRLLPPIYLEHLWYVTVPAIQSPLEQVRRTSIFAGFTTHKFSTEQVVQDGKSGAEIK